MKKISSILLLLLSCFLYGQNGVIKGLVIDKQSELPLIGATIELLNSKIPIGTTTDIDGYFTLNNIPLGRQVVRVSYVGYENSTIPDIEVNSGKDISLTITLTENFNQLSEIVITSSNTSKLKARNKFTAISARQFGIKEVGRYAGGRSDVARLASNFAGVAAPNDSRNDIVVRGNSPTGLLWRLEGIPIPSPNHFSTLGTTGSPISALNPNMLKNSDFITSAFPAEYGNAIGGVFDLGFRKGNKDTNEFSFQMGAFSGIELSAEGPFNKKNNGSFLIAARYSLIGLINGGGTSDTPNYMDISFNIDFGKSKLGEFSLFGIIGDSSIDFLGKDYDKDDLFSAPDENSFVISNVALTGLKHKLQLTNNSYLKTIIAGTFNKNDYKEERILNLNTPLQSNLKYTENIDKETRLIFSTMYNTKINQRLTLRTGFLAENFNIDYDRKDRSEQPDNDNDGNPDLVTIRKIKGDYTIFQPYIQSKYRLSKKLILNTGLHAMYSDLNEQFVIEPRASINWQLHPKHALNFGYGLHHQNTPSPLVFLNKKIDGINTQPNKNLDFIKSNHFVLGYDVKIAPKWKGKLELYHQTIKNAAVDKTPSSYSSLTEGADFTFSSDKTNLTNAGTGINQGLELTLEKSFSKGYHALITSSIFDSTYKGSDGIERNTPFNNGYVFNFLTGKEFKLGASKNTILSIDTRFVTAGGKYFTPVNLEASKVVGYQILDNSNAFSKQYDKYMRLDLKIGVTFNSKKRKSSHKFYVDLQNITDKENIFVKKYNRTTNTVEQVNQAGFFPDFGYRFQF
ncbi:TonB-dependent receptor [Tenacibaculum ovolyticum]|uniref:TonB-dependent receptor n=1 Tax=Tenacibaculum ovolyticum TaxID=104270 RepID=UPI001F256BEF|nr:TonB-dependent receptor [Tenacibaculum ovolyticum]